MGYRKWPKSSSVAVRPGLQRTVKNEPGSDEGAKRDMQEVGELLSEPEDEFGDRRRRRIVLDHHGEDVGLDEMRLQVKLAPGQLNVAWKAKFLIPATDEIWRRDAYTR